MSTVLFLLEEASTKACLQSLLPRFLPSKITIQYIVFDGKNDLEKNLIQKIRSWQRQDTLFVVIRDQDNENCVEIKRRLREKCTKANCAHPLIRIPCRELESWFIGDWQAVADAFEKPNLKQLDNKSYYRKPDLKENPPGELKKYLREYQKIDGARRIGRFLDVTGIRNRSNSYRQFITGIRNRLQLDTNSSV